MNQTPIYSFTKVVSFMKDFLTPDCTFPSRRPSIIERSIGWLINANQQQTATTTPGPLLCKRGAFGEQGDGADGERGGFHEGAASEGIHGGSWNDGWLSC